MKRSLNDITPVATSHNAGMKRVLLSAQESGCGITQIAITDIKAGEVAVNGNYECSNFGKIAFSVFSNSNTSFSVTTMQQYSQQRYNSCKGG